jgi:hypothetical protein
MNLHIVPDDKYISRFVERVELVGLSGNNNFVVKSPPPYKYISRPLNGARIGTDAFKKIIDGSDRYEQIFIHFMDEDAIDVVAERTSSKVNWLAWGADIYESLYASFEVLDDSTKAMLQVSNRSRLNRFVYKSAEKILKYSKFRSAYSKVQTMGNWIRAEYEFALKHLPGLNARHQMFFYDVDISFERLHSKIQGAARNRNVRVVLGQSTMPAGNHIGALEILAKKSSIGEVIIPASYGDAVYGDRLEKEVANRKFPFAINFLKTYQSFENYIAFLNSVDVIILNSTRPAGLGNFWIGVFLGKAVFLRKENLAFQMLRDLGLKFFSLDEWHDAPPSLTADEAEGNRQICLGFFAEEKINGIYSNFFR